MRFLKIDLSIHAGVDLGEVFGLTLPSVPGIGGSPMSDARPPGCLQEVRSSELRAIIYSRNDLA